MKKLESEVEDIRFKNLKLVEESRKAKSEKNNLEFEVVTLRNKVEEMQR